jgi:photosystem II stability/assembly factor-like uncharacterized protein
MFEHLDDPAPPAPTARTLGAVLARAAALRSRRQGVAFGAVGAMTLALGLVVGLLVAQPNQAQAVALFDSSTGALAPGTPVPVPDLAKVVFVDRSRGFGLALHGEQPVLARSDDGGGTWQVVNDHLPTTSLAQLEFGAGGHGYLWGGPPSSSGTVPLWSTSNGGRTWRQASPGPVVSDVSAVGLDAWAVVGTCPLSASSLAFSCPVTVVRSLDGGVTWSATPSAPPVSEEPRPSVGDQDIELARITPDRAYVLTYAPSGDNGTPSGHLAYTSDAGRTWETRPDPCPAAFGTGQQLAASATYDLWMVCASQASAGSQAKALYRSGDGGRSWTLSAAANAPVLSGGQALTSGGGLPVAGYVSPYSLGHENLAVLTATRAWLFADRSVLYQTSDGGQSWASVGDLARAGLVGGGHGNVVFVDATHGWVCEAGTGLWRTEDGAHWERLGT